MNKQTILRGFVGELSLSLPLPLSLSLSLSLEIRTAPNPITFAFFTQKLDVKVNKLMS